MACVTENRSAWHCVNLFSAYLMSNYKFATSTALLCVVLALLAFAYNYTQAPNSLPGYELIAAPAMLGLSFFSEELAFNHKMLIFIGGQFSLCFIFSLAIKFLVERLP